MLAIILLLQCQHISAKDERPIENTTYFGPWFNFASRYITTRNLDIWLYLNSKVATRVFIHDIDEDEFSPSTVQFREHFDDLGQYNKIIVGRLKGKLVKLTKNDARQVLVIHTNVNGTGTGKPLGSVDMYANNQVMMPGCTTDLCSHKMALNKLLLQASKFATAEMQRNYPEYLLGAIKAPDTSTEFKIRYLPPGLCHLS